MAKKLGLSIHWDAGVTTPEQRRERIREAARAFGLELMIGRNKKGAVITAGMAFLTCYGCAP